MRLLSRILLLLLALLIIVVAVVLYYVANPRLPFYTPVEQVNYLDQWSAAERQTYYFTPQGTQVKGLRYDWFTALELPFSQQRFASPEYLARFGFLVDPAQKASSANPGNLPVGFARHQNPGSTEQFLDITCAACHTGELRFKGQAIRIDGGSAQHVLPSSVPTLRGGSFGQALVASLASTYYNPWKFERFARQVLGKDYDARHEELRKAFKVSLDTFLRVAWNDTHRGLYPTEEGPGRTDAFGRIANASFGDAISPQNYRVANAPVDYPQLWDIWTFDWVQWNGSAQQPMARNVGEALGVGATLNFFDAQGKPLQGDARYPSSVRVRDLNKIEETLQLLKPPVWPEALLGPIDKPLAAKGRALFTENCAGCHVPKVVQGPDRPVQQLHMLPVQVIGTDPGTANNIADHRFDLTSLQWDPAELAKLDVQLHPTPTEPLDLSQLTVAKGLAYVTAFVENRAYRDAGVTPAERPALDGFGLPIGVRELRAYKARPLAGVWATPPFLHNGSVPTIYQLLSPQDERATAFYKGNFEYDPRHLGYRTEAFTNAFLFDTRITGNHNSGHEFRAGERGNGVIGRLLQPQERWALLEYLKVLGGPLETQL
ncbi:di-heme-cytochrome C peroxidase [Pseudomonas sp. P9_35]|uniref:di-heme-cytochrome C peroxidase n=1 Tax=unclassified Pseudomonas TaxID=196821 RepID=UPI002A365C04|nr:MULTISPECIES: di-heme-cytochrome C peroxidase [unclassified Pseudomonas]WPN62107.1 di-heme-cytochrome C peroxidase [Pseudomonas sp. P9_32]WPN67861.1 di-heme-cytochrome C peroxidase [Pseudomonas sp. P9_35]